jgi:predicted homoserine dehydrogenase-like protein
VDLLTVRAAAAAAGVEALDMNQFAKLQAREEAGRPIRVALAGAGKFGTMILAQLRLMRGVRLAVLADLNVERARSAAVRAGWAPEQFARAESASAANDVSATGRTALVPAGEIAAESEIDVLIEATGFVEAGALHAYRAIEAGHHVIMVTVEADVVVGPILHRLARRMGVVYSMAYGDQPALVCELIDWVRTSGFRLVAAGKGTKFLPEYRRSTPDTWHVHYGFTPEEVERGGFNGRMFNSFLDGTKSAIEAAAIVNATGLGISEGGLSFAPAPVEQLASVMCPQAAGGVLEHEGMVDIVTCMNADGTFVPNHLRWGVFVTFTSDSEYSRACWPEYGVATDPSGRYAALWRPYHFIGLEIGPSIASVALEGEATGAPAYGPLAEVVCATRRPMKAGESIDGEGGYAAYGTVVPGERARSKRLVPMGLATGLKLNRDVEADHAIGEADVTWDESSFLWRLRREQERVFGEPHEGRVPVPAVEPR